MPGEAERCCLLAIYIILLPQIHAGIFRSQFTEYPAQPEKQKRKKRKMDVEAASSAADVVQTSREAHSNTFFRSRRAAPNSAEPREHGTVPKAARSPDPSSHTKDIFEYFNHRKEQDGKNCCVLVAWKSGRYTFIVDVPVSDPNDEQQIYTDSRQEYYKRRGCWRKHLLFRDVEMVQWASVSLRSRHAASFPLTKDC